MIAFAPSPPRAADSRHRRTTAAALAATVAVLVAVASSSAAQTPDGGDDFAAAVETAHRADLFRSHPAFTADLRLQFGGNPVFAGTMLSDTAVGRTRLEREDGAVVVFDGSDAWVSPAAAELPQARFHALTWPYFLAAPYKLRDPGSHLEPLGPRPFVGGELPAARLTFDAGVGDSPDDWYVVHRDPASGRVAGLAYIVTYGGTDPEEAAREAHAITYEDWVEVEGVPIATRWRFWNWAPDRGIHGEAIGEVELEGFRFVTPAADAFTAPEGARRDELPTPAPR